MLDTSIEYAHIYTSNEIDSEHSESIQVLRRVTSNLNRTDFSLVVMVDDYSFPDPSFDYKNFSKWLTQQGFKPDILIRESQLIPLCDKTIELITDKKLKNKITSYITTKKKYPCSLFIATWYLLRLGVIESELYDTKLVAKKLLNILPISFKPFEDQGLEIIATISPDSLMHIHYEFIEGRLLA